MTLLEQYREAMQEFVDRCDRGEVKSRYTYTKFKRLLAIDDRESVHFTGHNMLTRAEPVGRIVPAFDKFDAERLVLFPANPSEYAKLKADPRILREGVPVFLESVKESQT